MSKSQPALGKLLKVYPTSPTYLQRAAIIALLSFVFFLATLVIFYIQQSFMYFILSTAFLVVYIFTLIGWVMQKRNIVSIHENGVAYRRFISTWDQIKSITADPKSGITIVRSDRDSITIGRSITGLSEIAATIRERLTL